MQAFKNKLLNLAAGMVPEKVKNTIVSAKNNSMYPPEHGGLQQSFSQQGEDLALARYFVGRGKGLYVDIGAYHPIKYSNTYLFWLRGWRGINVEPNPDTFNEFTIRRPGDTNLNLAVGPAEEPLQYFRFNRDAINTFNVEHKEKWLNKPNTKLKDVLTIQQVPLSQILDAHLAPGQPISFLDVDAEGNDLDVLMSNNWGRYRPEIVLAEHDFNFDLNTIQSPVTDFMKQQDYRIREICCGTIIFVDNLSAGKYL